jgi:hypothetical protein
MGYYRASGVSCRPGRAAQGGFCRSLSSLQPGKVVNAGGGAAAENGRAQISAKYQK